MQRVATWLLGLAALAFVAAPLEAALRARERLEFEWSLRAVAEAHQAVHGPGNDEDDPRDEASLTRAIAALRALPGASTRLVAGLDDPTDPRLRDACALALTTWVDDVEPVELDDRARLLLALLGRGTSDQEELRALVRAGSPALRDLLRREVRDRSTAAIRRTALELLGELRPPDREPADDAVVLPCLDDPDALVRQAALRTLLGLGPPGVPGRDLVSAPRAVRAAAERALCDPAPGVRLAAVRGLRAVERGRRETVRLVRELLFLDDAAPVAQREDAMALLPALPEAIPPDRLERVAEVLGYPPSGDWFFAALHDPAWTSALAMLVTTGSLRSPTAWLAWARLEPASAATWLDHGASRAVVDWLHDGVRRPALRELMRASRSTRLEAAAIEWLSVDAGSRRTQQMALSVLLRRGDGAAADALATFAAGARPGEDPVTRCLRRDAGVIADVIRGELPPRLVPTAEVVRRELREWLRGDAELEVPLHGGGEPDAEVTLALACLALADEPDRDELLGALGGRVSRALAALVEGAADADDVAFAGEGPPVDDVHGDPFATCACRAPPLLRALEAPPSSAAAPGRAWLQALAERLVAGSSDLARSTLHAKVEWLLRVRLLERGLGLRARLDPFAAALTAARSAPPLTPAHVQLRRVDGPTDPRLDLTWDELRASLEAHLLALGHRVAGPDDGVPPDLEVVVTLARAADDGGDGASWLAWDAVVRAGDEVVDVRARRPDALARLWTPIGVGQELARAVAIEARDVLRRAGR